MHAATTSVVRLVSVKSPGAARLPALPQVLPCLRASSATRRCSGARLLRPLRGQRPKRTPHQGDATGEGLRKRTCKNISFLLEVMPKEAGHQAGPPRQSLDRPHDSRGAWLLLVPHQRHAPVTVSNSAVTKPSGNSNFRCHCG